jgi:hypothetical protein
VNPSWSPPGVSNGFSFHQRDLPSHHETADEKAYKTLAYAGDLGSDREPATSIRIWLTWIGILGSPGSS